MNNESETVVTEFILSGLSHDVQTQMLLYLLFLLMYILTVFGNFILTCVIITSPHLHTPMYYFLCNLSFLDLFYSSSTVPKMLMGLISSDGGRISHTGCLTQMLISLFLGETECYLLAVMAYDRYIAICFPLRYVVIMSWKTCRMITYVIWMGSLLNIAPFRFCKGNIVDHFVCEILALLKLSCGDTLYYEVMLYFSSLFSLFIPFTFILMSYVCIIRAVLKIHSVQGRTKTFSTCASHLTVVFMFYGTSMTMYLGPRKYTSEKNKFISIIYGVVTPMLNPLIYSLRNSEVKRAVKQMVKS
uniref:Olfactory receptor n=1 Tax=Leptobrachium leishanense TaxID=445787 RepID=A0A8C5PG67_9ANUR